MSSLVASLCKSSEPLKRKLAVAIEAAHVLGTATSQTIASQHYSLDDQTPADDAYEASLLPPRIRQHYLETILEWALQSISESVNKGGKGCSLDVNTDIQPWQLVLDLMQASAPASACILTESLLPALQAVVSSTSVSAELRAVWAEILQRLMTTYRHVFRPKLEPAAQLAAAVLGSIPATAKEIFAWRHLACLVIRLLRGVASSHANPKDVFETICRNVLALLLPVAFAAQPPSAAALLNFANDQGGDEIVLHDPSAEARRLLQHVVFNPAHLGGLSSAAAAATSPASDSHKFTNLQQSGAASTSPALIGAEAQGAAGNKGPANSSAQAKPQYESLFWVSLAEGVQSAAASGSDVGVGSQVHMLQTGLPWMLKTFCTACRASQNRQTTDEEGGGGRQSQSSDLAAELPADADCNFFAALALLLLNGLKDSSSITNTAKDTALPSAGDPNSPNVKRRRIQAPSQDSLQSDRQTCNFMAWVSLARVASALLHEASQQKVYRPNSDPPGGQKALLGQLVEVAMQVEQISASDIVSRGVHGAAVQILTQVLELEHSLLHAQLPRLWALIWRAEQDKSAAASTSNPPEEPSSGGYAVNLVGKLVTTYAQLRQLPVLLDSLVSALLAAPQDVAEAAADVVCSVPVYDSLKQAVTSLPPGQTAALVDFVTSHWQATQDAHLPIIAPLAEVLGLSLEALQLDGALAPAVATATAALLSQLDAAVPEALKQTVLLLQDQSERAATVNYAALEESKAAALLRLHCAAFRLHAQCSAVRPDIQPVAYFSGVFDVDLKDAEACQKQAYNFSCLLHVLPKRSRTSEAATLVATTAACCSLWLQELREQLLRCRFTCPLSLSNSKQGTGTKGGTTHGQPHSSLGIQRLEQQISKLCEWLLHCIAAAPSDEASFAAPVRSRVASRVAPDLLLLALWPHLGQCLAAIEVIHGVRDSLWVSDQYTQVLKVCLRICMAQHHAGTVGAKLKELSEPLLSMAQLAVAPYLQLQLAPALGALVAECTSDSNEHTDAHPLRQLPRALVDISAAISAAGKEAAESLHEDPHKLSREQSSEQLTCALVQWAGTICPMLCSNDSTAASQLATLALRVEMSALGKAFGDDSHPPTSQPRIALVAASRKLLAAAFRQAGAAARVLWAQQGIWVAWLVTSWQLALAEGWGCVVAMGQNTCATIAASVTAVALQNTHDGISGNDAAAVVAFSHAIQGQLQGWSTLPTLQRLAAALGVQALLSPVAARGQQRISKKSAQATSSIAAGMRATKRTPHATKDSLAAAKMLIQQEQLGFALEHAISAAARAVQAGSGLRQLHDSRAAMSTSDCWAAAALLSAASCATSFSDKGPSHISSPSSTPDGKHPKCSQHTLQQASYAVHILEEICARYSSPHVGNTAQLATRDAEAVKQLLSCIKSTIAIIQAADHMTVKANDQAGQDRPEDCNGSVQSDNATEQSVPSAAQLVSPTERTAQHAHLDILEHSQLVAMHLRLLRYHVPVSGSPLPSIQGSSAWSGIPSIGGAPQGSSLGLRIAALDSLRQLVAGAAPSDKRATHAMLWSSLNACITAAEALPALEASLQVLEAAQASAPSGALTSFAGCFVSAVTMALSKAATSATSGWPCSSEPSGTSAVTATALATGLRCLDSVASRPRVFALAADHVAIVLQVPGLLFGSCGSGGHNFQHFGLVNGAGVFVAAARAIASVLRNHAVASRRCMASAVGSLHALLCSWMAWLNAVARPTGHSLSAALGKEELSHHLLKSCASAIAECWATVAQHSHLSRSTPSSNIPLLNHKYCVHLMADYMSIVLLPENQEQGSHTAKQQQSLPPDRLGQAAALRTGAYELYGACSPAEIQHLHVNLGNKGSGLGRSLLADLRRDFEHHHKYFGKI